jgi:hypothetical protein
MEAAEAHNAKLVRTENVTPQLVAHFYPAP